MHKIAACYRSLSSTISCVTDRIHFLPITMTGRFSKFNSISYTEDRHELRVTGTKFRLTDDTMSGTGEISISGAEVWNNSAIHDVNMTSSNFDVMSDNLWHHNSANTDDVVSKLSQFISRYRAYLLVDFHDDQRSRTCRIKCTSF